ncbi:hypothetical protein [Sphingomonas hankookensis]|uniref:hypothetical protein n=1 Tax=Sphingomonas hankookensis TaxID=563996 RepID=UPI003D30379B
MTDPRMTPTNDAPVTVERTLAAGRIIDIMTGGKFDWRSRLEDSDFLESADWLTALAYADAALASAPVEPAWHTDLGGLIEARRVAQAAYKDIERAKAQNTHIPGNPYDVALAALNPALGMLAILVEQPASAPAGDGAAADWLNTLPGVKPSDQFIAADRRLFEGLIDRVRVAALARPRAAVGSGPSPLILILWTRRCRTLGTTSATILVHTRSTLNMDAARCCTSIRGTGRAQSLCAYPTASPCNPRPRRWRGERENGKAGVASKRPSQVVHAPAPAGGRRGCLFLRATVANRRNASLMFH